MRKQKQPVSPLKIARALRLNPNTTRRVCQELLADDGPLEKTGRGQYQVKDRTVKTINDDKPVMSARGRTCAQFVVDWLSSGHLYVSSDIVVKRGKFKLGTARNTLARLAKTGAIARYNRGLYALNRSGSDKKPRGVSKDRRFARGARDVEGVRRVEVWDLLSPEDFAMHDLCFTLREGVVDNAPYMWCESNGALVFRFNTKNRSFASNAAWNATHCLGRDPLRPVKVNVWRDGFQIIFEARDKPVLPTEVMSVIAHLGWILREIHSVRSFDDLDHYQSHVGRDYLRAMEVSGPAYRMSVRDYFDRVLTWYVTSLKQADGSAVDVERHEAVDARRMSAKDWALFRTDPLTAIVSSIESLRAGLSGSLDASSQQLSKMAESQVGMVQQVDVLTKGMATIPQQMTALTNAMIVQAGSVNRLVEALEQRFAASPLSRFLGWVRSLRK